MAKKKPATDQTTLVTFLIDRSGSMGTCLDSTIEAFNGYLEELRKATTPILVTFLQFDHNGGFSLEKTHFEKKPKDIPDLSRETYQPRGGTPLIEAATKTINALETALKTKTDKPKIVVCIQTDGEENQSGQEYTWASLKALIEAKTKEGWQFNFMGAGIDAYEQGVKMGVSVGSTVSYDHTDRRATRSIFAESARNTRRYASGASASTSYSATQKQSAGDKYDPLAGLTQPWPRHSPAAQLPAKPTHFKPLDLTSGAGGTEKSELGDLDLTK